MADVGFIGEMLAIEQMEKGENHIIYLPLKDKGIDFITTKGDNTYFIQVKTSTFLKTSYFWFDLYKSKMKFSKNTYYIFVCLVPARRRLMGKGKHFFVVPSMDIKKWIDNDEVATKSTNPDIMNIFLYPDSENKTWKYKGRDDKMIPWTKYWNNFDLIK